MSSTYWFNLVKNSSHLLIESRVEVVSNVPLGPSGLKSEVLNSIKRFRELFEAETGRTNFEQHLLVLLIIKCLDDLGRAHEDYLRLKPGTFTGSDVDSVIAELKNIPVLENALEGLNFKRFEDKKALHSSSIVERLMQTLNVFKFTSSSDHLDCICIDDFCLFLLESFAEQRGKKEIFYTPRSVASLLVDLTEPSDDELIWDPSCGNSELLIASAGTWKSSYNLFGNERNHYARILGELCLFLAGLEAHISSDDIFYLDENSQLPAFFDVIISNPPFSLSSWPHESAKHGSKTYSYGLPPKRNADFAYLQVMLSRMKPEGGRMAVICSQGVLFRDGAEKLIREKMLRMGVLDTVIALPERLFSGTAIPVVVLVFRHREENSPVLFIDASKAHKLNKGRNVLHPDQRYKILDAYRNRKVEEGYSYLAEFSEIEENGFNLSLARYIKKVETRTHESIDELMNTRERLECEWAHNQARLRAALKNLGYRRG